MSAGNRLGTANNWVLICFHIAVVLERNGLENGTDVMTSKVMSVVLPTCPSCDSEEVVKDGHTRYGKQN